MTRSLVHPWVDAPVWTMFRSVARESDGSGDVLSLHRGLGVVKKGSVDGNHNRTPEDLTRYQAVKLKDVVVNRMKAWQGSAGVAPQSGIISAHYLVFEPLLDAYDSRFLGWLLQSPLMIERYQRASVGIRTSQWELSRGAFAELRIPRPPLETQRRIADMLDAETARIDTLIEKNERVLELLAVRDARVLEDEIYGARSGPVGIHYLATYVNGFPFKPEDRSDEGTPIVRIAQLQGDTRQQDFYAGTPDSYCHIDSGDLIFSWSATLAAKVWDGGPAFLNQHLFKVEPHEGIDRDWLLHALNAAVPRMKSLTHGSTMTHITRPMMTKIRVPKPNLEEQQRIVASIRVQFDRLAALRAKVDRQQELLRLRRQALITAAVTGHFAD